MKPESPGKELRFLIIEDEVHNSRMLGDMVHELRPQWKLEAILASIEESVGWLNSHPVPDLILLDIQLSDGISFSIFDHVNLPPSCRIIFTTAYDEYALRAFRVNSIDYLLKPIERKVLEEAFDKYERVAMASAPGVDYAAFKPEQFAPLFESIMKRRKEYRTRFLVSGISSWQKLETSEIAYMYSENKLLFAVDWKGKVYTLDYTLEQLESELDPDSFFRASRKIILHADAVKRIHNSDGGKLVVMIDPKPDFEVTVSRLKAGDFKLWMGK